MTDQEVEQGIREAMDGQPDEWVDAAVAQEMTERADLQRWAQQAYDGKQGGEFERLTKPLLDKAGEVTGTATYTMPKD